MDCGDTRTESIKQGMESLSVQQQYLEDNYLQGIATANANGNGHGNGGINLNTFGCVEVEAGQIPTLANIDPKAILTVESTSIDTAIAGGGGMDDGDSNRFFSWSSHATNKAVMPVHKDSEVYNMNHVKRGRAVIFNHENFHPSLDLGRRFGTERDKIQLKATMSAIGFDVSVFDDLTFQEIRAEVEKLAKEDHKERDCVAMAVLSHGDTQLMYAKDYSYKPDLLWQSFTADKCPSLAGKPKLFFIQACQGNNLDDGTKLQRVTRTEVDSNPQSYRIPNHADFLIAFSTVPGFYSWRNTTNGSWFIQALCSILQQYATKKDLLSMMTMVAREVALNFESNTPSNPQMHQKKQIPFITSTLIRDVYLIPK